MNNAKTEWNENDVKTMNKWSNEKIKILKKNNNDEN